MKALGKGNGVGHDLFILFVGYIILNRKEKKMISSFSRPMQQVKSVGISFYLYEKLAQGVLCLNGPFDTAARSLVHEPQLCSGESSSGPSTCKLYN